MTYGVGCSTSLVFGPQYRSISYYGQLNADEQSQVRFLAPGIFLSGNSEDLLLAWSEDLLLAWRENTATAVQAWLMTGSQVLRLGAKKGSGTSLVLFFPSQMTLKVQFELCKETEAGKREAPSKRTEGIESISESSENKLGRSRNFFPSGKFFSPANDITIVRQKQ